MGIKPTYNELENKIKNLESKIIVIGEREKLFNESQKIAKIGSWNLNLITLQLEWSQQTYKLFDKELEFKPSFDEFAKLVHPDDSETMQSSFNAAIASDDNPYHIIVRIINKSGREWYMEAYGVVKREILMDIKMPIMDGLEATQRIKKKNPDLTIIAVTGFAMASDEKKIMEAGCDEFITKPIDKSELLSQLNKYLKIN